MPESSAELVPFETVRHVATTCLCLQTQRAARALARRFDMALRPLDLTNQQFSLLMALNGAKAPSIGQLATFLVTDRTSLTAALKPLERRGLVRISPDRTDRRTRRLMITPAGVDVVLQAVPIWRETHALLDAALGEETARTLRTGLRAIPAIDRD